MGVDLLVLDLLRKRHTRDRPILEGRVGTCAPGKGTPGEQSVMRDTSASPQAGTAVPRAESSEPPGPKSQSTTSRLSSKEAGELNAARGPQSGSWMLADLPTGTSPISSPSKERE